MPTDGGGKVGSLYYLLELLHTANIHRFCTPVEEESGLCSVQSECTGLL